MIVAIALFAFSFLLSLFCLKETNPKIVGRNYLKKVGIVYKQTKQEKKQQDSMAVTLKKFVLNKDLVILFFAYIFSLCCTASYRNAAAIHLSKTYGFTNVNEAKAFSSIAQIVGLGIGSVVWGLTSPILVRFLGEIRCIIIC